MKIETIVLNEMRNVTLTAITQPVRGEFANIPKRPAILVLPGGGYKYCSEREAEPVALEYVRAGYQAFVLRYSVGKNAVWPNPLDDYEQAMRLIRGKADEWNLYPDKIAVIGFSAGAHLAGAAATMAVNRPDAALLGYAVLTGESARDWEKTAPDLVTEVDRDTPPCFLFASRTDDAVPVINTVKFEEALIEHNISFESHIYAYGPHGFSTGDSSVEPLGTPITKRASHWVEDSISWLREAFGDFGNGTMTEPAFRSHVTSDDDPFLSVDCTMGKIMSNPESAEILNRIMQNIGAGVPKEEVLQGINIQEVMKRMKLRDGLAFGHVPQGTIEALDRQLRQIPNQS